MSEIEIRSGEIERVGVNFLEVRLQPVALPFGRYEKLFIFCVTGKIKNKN